MNNNTDNKQYFVLKARAFTLTVLHILDYHIDGIVKQLEETIAKAPALFNYTPIIIDCPLTLEPIELESICEILRAKKLIPVALQGNNMELAKSCGLAYFKGNNSTEISYDNSKTSVKKPAKINLSSKIVTAPVRSGQQLVSKNGDLIVVSAVSNGAELLSDGNIHVYGVLRGRALAGISGDVNARIFCQSLDAELIAIAGVYRLKDTMEPINTACQIYLKDEQICIEAL